MFCPFFVTVSFLKTKWIGSEFGGEEKQEVGKEGGQTGVGMYWMREESVFCKKEKKMKRKRGPVEQNEKREGVRCSDEMEWTNVEQ